MSLWAKGSTIATGLRDQPNRARPFYPSLCRHDEAVQACLVFNPIEFDGIKNGIIQALPETEELNGISVSHPILNDVVSPFTILVAGNVGQRDIVLLMMRQNCDAYALHGDGGFFVFAHGWNSVSFFRCVATFLFGDQKNYFQSGREAPWCLYPSTTA